MAHGHRTGRDSLRHATNRFRDGSRTASPRERIVISSLGAPSPRFATSSATPTCSRGLVPASRRHCARITRSVGGQRGNDCLRFQKLDAYKVAKEFAGKVHRAGIREVVGAIDVGEAIGALGSEPAGEILALAVRLKQMRRGLMR